MMHFSLGRLARCTVALAAAGVLAGCAPLVVGGVVVGGTSSPPTAAPPAPRSRTRPSS